RSDMPTIISHPFAALALTPTFRRLGLTTRELIVGAACCALPDIDVIGFKLGIPYHSLFGHRGITHSFFFATLVAFVLTPLMRGRYAMRGDLATLFGFLWLCVASHPLFDAFTSGGEGVAFFAPFSDTRYFFPWRPIRVSPIGIGGLISGRGLVV